MQPDSTWSTISKKNISADSFIIAVLITCFAIGTITHFIDVIRLGFLGYSTLPQVSLWQNIFWSLLLFLDPLVIILLITKRPVGAILASFVITADVLVNYRYVTVLLGANSFDMPAFALQSACLLFSVLTLPKILSASLKNCRAKNRILFLFAHIPVPVLGLGLLIHTRGLLSLFSGTVTVWSLWVHGFMLIFDSVLLYLILRQRILGLRLGMAAFGILGLMQAAYAGGSFISPEIPFTLEMGLYMSVCFLSVAALWAKKERVYV